MKIDKFNAWLESATPDALERVERALDAGARRVDSRYWKVRLDRGRIHWMRREVIKKRGTRDYVADLEANGWAVATVYEQIRDWLDSQNYVLPLETLTDKVNPREQQIKAAIAAARLAREGRKHGPRPQLEENVRIPWRRRCFRPAVLTRTFRTHGETSNPQRLKFCTKPMSWLSYWIK